MLTRKSNTRPSRPIKRRRQRSVHAKRNMHAPIISKRRKKPNTIMISRLRALIEQQNTNPREVAAKAGIGATAVYDLINGKSITPSHDLLHRVAEALTVSIDYLTGISHDPRASTNHLVTIPVLGYAETGVWQPMVSNDAAQQPFAKPIGEVQVPPPPHYPNAPYFALIVRDNSMDAIVTPGPLLRGMMIGCIDLTQPQFQLPLESGQVYVIREIDEQKMQQQFYVRRLRLPSPSTRTMKEGEPVITIAPFKTADGERKNHYQLIPESTQPIYQPQTYPGTLTSDPHARIHAWGLVYYSATMWI